MPASGDNKPKLQKFINKAVATAEVNYTKRINVILSIVSAVMLLITNGGILFLCLTSNSSGDHNTMLTAVSSVGFITAMVYLWRMLDHVPDNH